MPAGAQTRKMIVTTRSSEPVPIEVSTDTRISFSDDLSKMIVSSVTPDNPLSFDIDDIANIVFTLDSSVDTLSDIDGLVISCKGGVVSVCGACDIEYRAWDIAGHSVCSGSGRQSVSLDFTGYPAGVYVVKINDKILKFINR